MKRFDTIIYDFDGTIMDTSRLIIESWQHTFEKIDGKRRAEEEIIATLGETLPFTMANFFPDYPLDKAIEIYRNFQVDGYLDSINTFPGMKEVMKEVHSIGIRTAIVTSRVKRSTIKGLQHFGLEKYVDEIVAMDDIRSHKPDPEGIHLVMKVFNSTPEKTILIGDTKYDVQAARNAGIKSGVVGWTETLSEEELTGKYSPDFYFEEASEILEIL
ncbi:MAG: HAD-IA family hydrolase [Anaerovoracaceae bacterium]